VTRGPFDDIRCRS